MKVVSVLHFPEFGGPHNQALRLAPAMIPSGVSSVTVLPPGPGAERLTSAGLAVVPLKLGRVRAVLKPSTQMAMLGRFPIDIASLIRLYRRERPDVVQLNGLMNPHAAVAARLLGIPVVWQLLDTRPPMRVRKVIMPLVRALADVVMPIGHGVARAHPGAESFGDRMVVFYPPVDTDTFRPGLQSTLRSELKLPDDAPIVGVVGNVNPQKGHEYFIEAAGIVRRTVPDARFVIAGHIYNNHDAYYRQLLEAADQNGLKVGEELFFLGARSDIPNVLAGLDLFALASVPNSEGTPTVVLEAMASGVPVVATDVGSVAEVVDDGKTGFVVRSEDPVAMANRITSLLQDDGLRQRAGKAARERVERHFSLDRCIDAHVLAYKLAIAKRNRSGRGRQNE